MRKAEQRLAFARGGAGEGLRPGKGATWRAAGALLLAALAGACSSGGDSEGGGVPPNGDPGDGGEGPTIGEGPYALGEALAKIELVTPNAATYLLRATVPLPRGVYPMESGNSPFAVRDPHGTEFPAQVEIVSWYADEADGADVVEVLAKVDRTDTYAPGEWVAHEVVWAPHPRGSVTLDPDVEALLGMPQGVMLRTRDVFGNLYRADLLRDRRAGSSDLRVLRDGAVAHQVRTHETLMPAPSVPGPQGTLPHLMGAHSFVTAWDGQPFFSLDLRVHNGHDGLDPADPRDDPLGKIYFRELELVLPADWQVFVAFEDPMWGEPYTEGPNRVWPIVEPMDDGFMHMMPQQAQFHRRLVVTKHLFEPLARVHLREEALGFCQPGVSAAGREYFSWWNPETARYFPQKEVLPELWHLGRNYVRQQLIDRYRTFEATLRLGHAGPFPVMTDHLGWAHPWGLDIGYAHGGDEIHLFDGIREAYAGCSEGYRTFQITHRMSTERHPVALFDGDGDAFTLEDWIVEGPNGQYMPAYIWMYPVLFLGDPFGFEDSPSFQRQAVQAMGLKPPYENLLLGYQNIDREHLIRYTRSPKVLAWLGNDALAKDDLRMQGELTRAGYSILPQDPWGGYIYTGLLNDRTQVDRKPNVGLAMHRGEGWGIDATVAAYCLADPAWREKTRSWFYDVLDLLEDGISSCSGIISGDPNLDTFGAEYRSRQSISAAIMQNAFWSVLKSVFHERDPEAYQRMATVLEADLYGGISDVIWNDAVGAPYFQAVVGPYDLDLPDYCEEGEYPPDGFLDWDAYQTWCAFAYGYRLTGDPIFLDYAVEMLGEPLNTPALAGNEFGWVENRAALLGLIQEIIE